MQKHFLPLLLPLLCSTPAMALTPAPLQIADTVLHPVQLAPDTAQRQLLHSERRIEHRLAQPGASFIKVHFQQLKLPDGAYVQVSSADGSEYYRYDGRSTADATFNPAAGEDGRQRFAAMSVRGEQAQVTLVLPAGVVWQDSHQLRIDKFFAGHASNVAPDSDTGALSTCGINERRDAACYASSHASAFDRSRPVARLLIGGSGLCTGWRVGKDNHLLTNNHCVATAGELSSTEVWFNYQHSQCGKNSPATVVKVTGQQLFRTDYNLDYTLFSVNEFARISAFGHLGLTVRPPQQGESIFIPQHGAGNPKELAIFSDQNNSGVCEIDVAVTAGRAAGTDTGYYCDTIGGSSGSPVIAAQTQNAIALHHFGGCTNQGVLISKIWPQVADIFNQQVPVGDQQGGGNQPPVAEFNVNCDGYFCRFSAEASSDPDGRISGYHWQFGDGLAASGMVVEHQYQTTGRLRADLTVVDQQQASASKSRELVISDPAFTLIQSGEAKTNLRGDKDQQLNFRLNTLSTHQRVQINSSGGTGDVQLYVRTGSAPDVNQFDCKSAQSGNQESCSLFVAEPATVYLRLVGQSLFSGVTLLATSQTVPPSGFPKQNQSAAKGSWLRYEYKVMADGKLSISSTGGSGDADLYVQKGTAPSTTLYDCRPYKQGNNESCSLTVKTGEVIHIGLRAYQAFSGLTLDVQ